MLFGGVLIVTDERSSGFVLLTILLMKESTPGEISENARKTATANEMTPQEVMLYEGVLIVTNERRSGFVLLTNLLFIFLSILFYFCLENVSLLLISMLFFLKVSITCIFLHLIPFSPLFKLMGYFVSS
eukprot:TRINITY_DN15339_c0_g2_i1.p1 TRINITY_DN15339_c0_g2~~TRINITY_DN15339_c0_g2_i1.p1  ORF type:complete len:129 (+),score=2.11 TRINITY_DN15339_c0_g2_i1:863-1249(+)